MARNTACTCGIGDGVVEVGGEPEAVLAGEAAHVVRLLADAMHEAELAALALHGRDQRLAPAPEPDDGGIDHMQRNPGSAVAGGF